MRLALCESKWKRASFLCWQTPEPVLIEAVGWSQRWSQHFPGKMLRFWGQLASQLSNKVNGGLGLETAWKVCHLNLELVDASQNTDQASCPSPSLYIAHRKWRKESTCQKES